MLDSSEAIQICQTIREALGQLFPSHLTHLLQPLVFQPEPGANSRLPEEDLQPDTAASAAKRSRSKTIFDMPPI